MIPIISEAGVGIVLSISEEMVVVEDGSLGGAVDDKKKEKIGGEKDIIKIGDNRFHCSGMDGI